MVSWEWDPNYVPPVKLGLHCAQILLSFVAWCLALAVFAGDDARITGNNGWTFGVCFLSVPAWVYLIMTPRWQRTRRFAQPHAMMAVDIVFTIVWISAFATQAAYNSNGDCGEVCNISGGVVGLGVIIAHRLLFVLSSLVSGYTVQYFKFHGNLPGYDSRKIRGGSGDSSIDPDKAAFSMAPHDDEAYERVNMDDNDHYGHANPYSADDYDDPNRYGALPPRQDTAYDADTAYSSGAAGGAPSSLSGGNPYGSSAAQNPFDGPAQFPSGEYDRITR